MADFLDVKLKEIDDRLAELRPLVEEHGRLEAARAALAGVGGGESGSGRRRGPAAGRRRRRRRGGATRANQAMELVQARPGITIPELADAMKIKPNYLYRILPSLKAEGAVRKEGKGWYPAR